MRAELKKYADSVFSDINKICNEFPGKDPSALIHELRICIKKLKAVMKMLNYADEDFQYKKIFKPLKEIFQSTTKMRNYYVFTFLAKSNHIKKIPQTGSIDLMYDNFKKSIHANTKKLKRINRKTDDSIRKLNKTQFRDYLDQQSKDLKSKLFPSIRIQELHEARRIMKELHYLRPFLKKKNKIDPFLDKISPLIGDWHDHIMLIRWLRPISDEKTVNKLKGKNQKQLLQIRKNTRVFYSGKDL